MAECKRCKIDRALVKAHIIPKAFWKIPDQKLGPLAMVSNLPGWRTEPSPIGPYDETILCEDCDGYIGRLDQHAAEFLLRDRSKSEYQNGLFGLYCYRKADPALIISFVASLAWRASISTHHFFSRVRLGPYENKFAEVFNRENTSHLEDCIVVMEYDEETPTIDPHMSRIEGLNVLSFHAERFLIHIKIDQRPFSNEMRQVALHSTRPVISMVKNWEESKQREAMLKITEGISKPQFWKV